MRGGGFCQGGGGIYGGVKFVRRKTMAVGLTYRKRNFPPPVRLPIKRKICPINVRYSSTLLCTYFKNGTTTKFPLLRETVHTWRISKQTAPNNFFFKVNKTVSVFVYRTYYFAFPLLFHLRFRVYREIFHPVYECHTSDLKREGHTRKKYRFSRNETEFFLC